MDGASEIFTAELERCEWYKVTDGVHQVCMVSHVAIVMNLHRMQVYFTPQEPCCMGILTVALGLRVFNWSLVRYRIMIGQDEYSGID